MLQAGVSFFFLPVFVARTQRQSGSTHLEAAAQGVYFCPQRCVFLRDFVLLLSLIFSFLQSLSQLAVKPESTQKHTEKKQTVDIDLKKFKKLNGTTAPQQAASAPFRRTPASLAAVVLLLSFICFNQHIKECAICKNKFYKLPRSEIPLLIIIIFYFETRPCNF